MGSFAGYSREVTKPHLSGHVSDASTAFDRSRTDSHSEVFRVRPLTALLSFVETWPVDVAIPRAQDLNDVVFFQSKPDVVLEDPATE